jgi:hypothetical protein
MVRAVLSLLSIHASLVSRTQVDGIVKERLAIPLRALSGLLDLTQKAVR